MKTRLVAGCRVAHVNRGVIGEATIRTRNFIFVESLHTPHATKVQPARNILTSKLGHIISYGPPIIRILNPRVIEIVVRRKNTPLPWSLLVRCC